jgi:hypothetical protein
MTAHWDEADLLQMWSERQRLTQPTGHGLTQLLLVNHANSQAVLTHAYFAKPHEIDVNFSSQLMQ